MLDYYVCRFVCKYASELVYPLRVQSFLAEKKSLNVLSVGCGPCTDLLAIDYLKQIGKFQYEALTYIGVDNNSTWNLIHNDLNASKPQEISLHFRLSDICDKFTQISESLKWIPDLIVFQYVLSDMQKHTETTEIDSFVLKLSDYINNRLPVGSIIIMNDINLDNTRGGGRNFFDQLGMYVSTTCGLQRHHFENDFPLTRTYRYGEQWPRNDLVIQYPRNSSNWNGISRLTSCSSAQMVITKR